MFEFITKLSKSPKYIFIVGILSNWYSLIMIPAFMATYYFFDAMEKSPKAKAAKDFIVAKLNMTVKISQNCSYLIFENLFSFFQCAANYN
jgi:hypothetical protein